MNCPTLTFFLSSASGIVPSGKINITNTDVVNVFNYAEAQIVDANLIPENIVKDINILGIVGTYEGGTTPTGELIVSAPGTYNVTNYATCIVDIETYDGSVITI